MSTQENLRQIFQAPFSYNEYCHLIVHSIFGCNDIQAQPTPIETTSDNDQCYYIGRMEDADRRLIGFFYTRVADGADVRRKRVGLRKLISPYLKYEVDAAIAVFDDGQHWRLSYICDLKNESTTPRRFSYVMGDAHGQYRTPIEQLLKLQSKQLSLSDLHNAFSVEALSKEFYTDLFNWFQWATTPEKSGVYFPNDTNTTDDDFENLELKVIRLITRLMFIWFIKQKQLVPEKLFDATEMAKVLKDFDPQSDTQGCYYNAILQNLFFATLNRAIVDDDGTPRAFATLKNSRDVKSLYRYAEMFAIGEQQVIDMFSTVPFLNGGLFECLDKTKKIDGVDKAYNYDGFSRNDARFANGRYKHRAMVPNRLFFDPNIGLFSVLNRYNFTIEENSPNDLLVALDPEMLGKVFENLLGYYNPETRDTARNQSGSFYTPRPIVNYMVDESLKAYLGNTPLVNEIFKDDFQPDDLHWPDYQGIAAKLKSVKVFDPACGSGAFPLGLLNRIVELLQRLDPENNSTNGSYKFKLHLIEHCLYGCDIQSIAAQITKLRFFISLVCDCERDNSKPNFGIPTLPNLETKFVTANTLIGLTRQPGNILFLDTESKKTELRRVRHQHFNARTASEKIKLRNLDAQLRNELRELLVNNSVLAAADAQQMVEWNPYDQNAVSPFFDPEWMFGVSDGFDIVIGNPPYVEVSQKQNQYTTYFKTAKCNELYAYFFEKSINLLKDKGILTFITASLYIKGMKFQPLREYLEKKTQLISLQEIGDKAFENVKMPTAIFICTKQKEEWHFSDYIQGGKILEKIEKSGIILEHICDIQRGFEIGRNSTNQVGTIPFLTGSNVARYSYNTICYITSDVYKNFMKEEYYFTGPRLLLRETGSLLTVLYLDEYIYSNRSLYSIKITHEQYPPKFVLACLNSKALQYYYSMKFKNNTEIFPKIRIKQARQLPIPTASSKQKSILENIVNKIIETIKDKHQADISNYDAQINEIVYQLYGLTKEEIDIIEDML